MIGDLISDSRRAILILSALFLAGIFGCSRGRVKFEDLPTPAPSVLLAKVKANRAALKDFKGSGSLEISNSKMGRSMMGVALQHVSPDQLLFSVYGPMGICLGGMLLDGDRYKLNYGLPPFHAEGSIEDFQFPEDFGFLLRGEDILRVLLPLDLISPLADSVTIQKDIEIRQFRLDWSTSEQRHSLWIDPYRPVSTRDMMFSEAGDTLVIKEMGEFSRHSGVHFPLEWKLRLGAAEEENFMRFKLRRLTINTGLEPGDLRLAPPDPADSIEVGHGG